MCALALWGGLTRSLPAECSEDNPCEGLSRHATFSNFASQPPAPPPTGPSPQESEGLTARPLLPLHMGLHEPASCSGCRGLEPELCRQIHYL